MDFIVYILSSASWGQHMVTEKEKRTREYLKYRALNELFKGLQLREHTFYRILVLCSSKILYFKVYLC